MSVFLEHSDTLPTHDETNHGTDGLLGVPWLVLLLFSVLRGMSSFLTETRSNGRYVTESYLQTPEGREEAERAKREGSKAYLQAKEIILRPGVFGGLAGFRECKQPEFRSKLISSQRRCYRYGRILQLQALEPPMGPKGCFCRICWSPRFERS